MLFWFLIFLPISYLFLLFPLGYGWRKSRRYQPATIAQIHSISVIVAVRNERETILTLLEQLEQSNYPSFEVIIVDDHSSDGTFEAVHTWVERRPRFKCRRNRGDGKKKAISEGVALSSGDLILTTDGDCSINVEWLEKINRCFHAPHVMLAFGGVAIHSDGKLFSDMQAVEFASLIGSSASFSAMGAPVMCNGANLAFRKSAFEAVDGYSGNLDVPSGDDEFLMRKIKKTFPQGVIFIPFEDAVVRTVPKESVAAFFAQRIRWAGKWKRNDSYFAKFLALYVFAVQIAFVGLIVLMILPSIGVSFKIVASAILVFRFAMEAIFLRSVCRFLQVKWRWSAYVLVQLFYPYYVVGTGLFSNLMSVTWKNRRII